MTAALGPLVPAPPFTTSAGDVARANPRRDPMRDAAEILKRLPEPPAAPPLAPWDYIRLRREAAGLSIAQAASRMIRVGEGLPEAMANLRTFEFENIRVKNIERFHLGRTFPFSAEVYRQLAFLPAEQHPRICRSCGWDHWTPQIDLDGNERRFAAERADQCTLCALVEARGLRRHAA